MRKRDETLREALLQYAKETGIKEGTEAINIRTLAKQANVSVGTVYNYFENKDDILLALTEEYWRHMLEDMRGAIRGETFVDQVREIFAFLSAGMDGAGAELMGSLRGVEQTGRDRMENMQKMLRAALVQRMEQDKTIRADLWNEAFTREQYADFVLINLLPPLRMKARNIDFFLQIIRKTLYP